MPEKAVGVGDGPREVCFMVVSGTQKGVGGSECIVGPRRMQILSQWLEHAAIAFPSQTNTNHTRDTLYYFRIIAIILLHPLQLYSRRVCE